MTLETTQEAPAAYFDGVTNRKHQIELRMGTALDIVEDGVVIIMVGQLKRWH